MLTVRGKVSNMRRPLVRLELSEHRTAGDVKDLVREAQIQENVEQHEGKHPNSSWDHISQLAYKAQILCKVT